MNRAKKIKKLSLRKKLFPTFISSIPHQKNLFKKTLKLTIYVAIILFLLFNIVLSQNIRPEYFQMLSGDQTAVVYYLQSMRRLPQFSSEFNTFKSIYGNSLENAFFRKEEAQKIVIQNLEQILQKNPYSRDVLYSLFWLYRHRGDNKIAEAYLQRAKEVDPMLK